MPLARAIVIYDLTALAMVALDFVFVSRKNASVIATVPAAAMVALALVLTWQVDQPIQFAAVVAVVTVTALFGYANMLAFLKRGITFSILSNHARPAHERRPDADFIALAERVAEMESHGWLRRQGAGLMLTDRGRRVLRLRRILLQLLRIEAVG
jgi:hypothetical protein